MRQFLSMFINEKGRLCFGHFPDLEIKIEAMLGSYVDSDNMGFIIEFL